MIKKLLASFSYALTALIILMLLPGIGRGQLLVEDFNYDVGTVLTATATADPTTGWLSHSGNGTANIDVTAGLSFTGYAGSGIGGAANVDNNGQDINKTFTSQTSGVFYVAFMLQTSSTNFAGYFFMLSPDPVSSTFNSRIFVNATGNGIGLSATSSAPGTYVAITPGTTVLVVIKHNFTSNTTDLFVLNSFAATEPGSASQSISETYAIAGMGAVAIRQYNSSQRQIIDGIRVGTTWASVCAAGSITAPTTQATNITFSSVASTSFTADWVNGNGSKRAVFVKQANTGTAVPADNTTYSASTTFGSGTQIGSTGWYCVYNGTGTSVAISGLTALTDYMVHVCEYNGAAGSELYNITLSTDNPLTQATIAGAIAPTVTSPTATAIALTSATLGGNITLNGGSTITERGTVWSLTTPVTITDNKLAEGGTTTGIFTQNRTSLPSGTLIYYAAYATNSVGATLSSEDSFTTLFAEPTNHVTAFAAGTATSSTVPLTWTDAVGGVPPAGYLILWNTSGTFTDPVDGVAQVNGSSVQNIAQGVQTYTVTGLTSSTPYYFKIYPYSNSGTNIDYKTDGTVPTANATTPAPPPVPTADVISRPSHIDLASVTSESAVLVKISNYSTNDVRFRLYNGGNQYNCWDETTDAYITSSSYSDGPSVPGTPTTSSTFWILSERGNNNATVASYRDRLGPTYPSNNLTAALPAATSITAPFALSGTFVGSGLYDNSIKHVVLVYSGVTLVSAAATTISSGLFSVVCPDGTTIDKIEIRAIDNNLIESLTGSWTTSTNVGNIPDVATTFTGTGNWSASGNWSNGIPSAAIDAVIDGAVTVDVIAEVKDLTINSGKSVTISANRSLSVNGSLNNNSGTSGLIINSGGQLKNNTTGVAGTVNLDVTGGTPWHLFCLPTTAGVPASPFFDLAYLDEYVESTGAWNRLGDASLVAPNTGYSINYASGTHTLPFTGTLNNAAGQTFSGLSHTATNSDADYEGWHLLGNTFSCGIDASQITYTGNVNGFAYIWDPTGSGNYISYALNGGSPTGSIAPMQGFFVKVTNSTNSINIPTTAKTLGGTFFKSINNKADILNISIEGNGYSDKAYVRFDPSSSTDFDQPLDAYKLDGIDAAPQIYSILSGHKATVNTLPSVEANPNVELGLKVGAATTYTLNASGMDSFDASLPINLYDIKTGTTQDLRLNPVYSFTAAPGDAENRFMLSFADVTGITKLNKSGVNMTAANGIIRITHDAAVSGTVFLYSVSGQLLAFSTLNKGETTFSIASTGVYIVKVVSGKTSVTQKMIVLK